MVKKILLNLITPEKVCFPLELTTYKDVKIQLTLKKKDTFVLRNRFIINGCQKCFFGKS